MRLLSSSYSYPLPCSLSSSLFFPFSFSLLLSPLPFRVLSSFHLFPFSHSYFLIFSLCLSLSFRHSLRFLPLRSPSSSFFSPYSSRAFSVPRGWQTDERTNGLRACNYPVNASDFQALSPSSRAIRPASIEKSPLWTWTCRVSSPSTRSPHAELPRICANSVISRDVPAPPPRHRSRFLRLISRSILQTWDTDTQTLCSLFTFLNFSFFSFS